MSAALAPHRLIESYFKQLVVYDNISEKRINTIEINKEYDFNALFVSLEGNWFMKQVFQSYSQSMNGYVESDPTRKQQ